MRCDMDTFLPRSITSKIFYNLRKQSTTNVTLRELMEANPGLTLEACLRLDIFENHQQSYKQYQPNSPFIPTLILLRISKIGTSTT